MKRPILLLLSILLSLLVGSGAPSANDSEKFKVTSVVFDGNKAFSERSLKKVMLTRKAGFLRPSYYHPDIFKEDLLSLEEFYRQNGYLEIALGEVRIVIDSTKQTVDILIPITEGELTHVEDLAFLGNTVFSDDVLFEKANIRSGDPLKRLEIQNTAVAILTLYSNNGYLETDATPDVRINEETHRALVDFLIEENNQFRVGQILLEGADKTKPAVVQRELLFSPGDIVRYSHLLQSQRDLYLTGLFESVFIRPQPPADEDSAKKDILVELRERMAWELNAGIGYGSIEKARLTLGLANMNLAGTARKVGLTGKISFVNRRAEISFTEPWTLGYRWRTDINLLTEYAEEPGFDLTRTGGRIEVGRSFSHRSSASLTYRQEQVNLRHIRVRPVPEKYKINLRTLTLSLVYDTRDNLFNSTRGLYLEWTNEMAGAFLRGTDTFVRSIGRAKYFHRLTGSTLLAHSLEAGWMDVFGSSREIPLNERFFTGGPNSLRGFEYRLVGPLDENDYPLGGKFKTTLNLEVRQGLYKWVGGVLFTDMGNVWKEMEGAHLDDIRVSPGLGLRVNTPLGIFRCDYGINVKPRRNEASGRVVFNMGQAF
jgi:outer membrane protein insertion porin family